MANYSANKKGYSLIEMIAVIGIIGIIAVGVSTFVVWGMRLWNITQDQIKAQDQARVAFQQIAGELREMQISDNGSYDIESATGTSIIFYSNVDSDSKREKIKYELQNGTLYRWYVKSDTATPPQYPAFNNTNRSVIVTNVQNTTNIFQYYDDTYTGTSAPLASPVSVADIRLIKLTLLIDFDPTRSPVPLELQTNVTLRNIKDNL